MTRLKPAAILKRNLRWMLFTTSSVVFLLSVTPQADTGVHSPRPPNVVVILVDDLGWAEVGDRFARRIRPGGRPYVMDRLPGPRTRSSELSGDDIHIDRHDGPIAIDSRHTPHVDSLLARGIELTQYLTHARCSPSRAGLLTGRHYTRVGSGPEVGGTLDLHVSNLARDLQGAGYATGAFGKWHNGYPNFPADGNGLMVSTRNETDPDNDRFENFKGIPWGPGVNAYGFDEWQGFYGGAVDFFNRMSWWDNETNWWTNRRYTPHVTGHTIDVVAAAAVDFLVRHRDVPFFCYVAMPAPHNPLHVYRWDLEKMSSFIPGGWQSVRGLTSPTTGRRLEDVEELRCGPGEEFDHTVLDPDGTGFSRVARAALVYAMDRGIGEILTTLGDLGLSEQTVVWFAGDNGGNTEEHTHPFRGFKGSLYEGGIRSPAVLLWPGTLDAVTSGYFDSNTYPYHFQFLDIYPTTMSMAGLTPSESDLDGRDGFAALLSRTPIRPIEENSFFSFNRKWATVRSGRWKLLHNEAGSAQTSELYDLVNDPHEKTDIGDDRPEIKEELISDLHRFMLDGRLAMAYFPQSAGWVPAARPSPAGEVLEIFAIQTDPIEDGDLCGLFVKFASAGIKDYDSDQLEPTDLMSFDLLVASDSDLDRGFFVTPGRGSSPLFDSASGVDTNGVLLVDQTWPRDQWVRTTVGIGNIAPLNQAIDYIALRSSTGGTYHFFLDNVSILRHDGSTKAVIWASKDDSLQLRYRYCGAVYDDWESMAEVSGFPFSEVSVRTVD